MPAVDPRLVYSNPIWQIGLQMSVVDPRFVYSNPICQIGLQMLVVDPRFVLNENLSVGLLFFKERS